MDTEKAIATLLVLKGCKRVHMEGGHCDGSG